MQLLVEGNCTVHKWVTLASGPIGSVQRMTHLDPHHSSMLWFCLQPGQTSRFYHQEKWNDQANSNLVG